MAYPLDNLGDYNVVRNALKETNGNAKILFQNIGAATVAKESPRIFKDGCLTGIGIGVGICSVIYVGYRYYKNKKNEKEALNAEPKLKKELTKTVENTYTKTEFDETPHQN